MTRRRRLLAAQTTLAGLFLVGCATTEGTASFAPPQNGDDGVVIAESAIVEGVSNGQTAAGSRDDCSGPGLGVTVQSTLADGRYLFDKNGEPCEAAQTLFDGRQALYQRQADPSIQLSVHDSLGPVPDKDVLPGLKPLPEIRLKSEVLPGEGALAKVEPAAGTLTTKLANKSAPTPAALNSKGPDPVLATLESWNNQDAVYAQRSTEADAAAARNIANIAKTGQGTTEQETMAKLMAQLRERERQVQEEQRRHEETLERAQENRQITTAARTEWQQKEQQLQASLTATQARLGQYEQLSQRLSAEQSAKEKAYQDQISTLNADLKAAEAQADTSRRQLVLQAAAKIAEAEQLATAAKLQEQDIKLREAARLKAEAETMMDRALAIKAGQSVVVNGVGAPPAVPLALMETPIVLHANDQTLPELLSTIMKLAAPQAGEWKTDWQLSSPTMGLMKEKWSLTAEAPVQQVLFQLKQQVKEAHGVDLVFTQFGQSRLLVVTDATVAPAEGARTGKK